MNVKTSNMSCRNMFKSEAVLDNVTQLAMNFLLCVRITFVCHAICCHKHSCIFCLLPYLIGLSVNLVWKTNTDTSLLLKLWSRVMLFVI